jgi:hypothetical protein
MLQCTNPRLSPAGQAWRLSLLCGLVARQACYVAATGLPRHLLEPQASLIQSSLVPYQSIIRDYQELATIHLGEISTSLHVKT